MQRLPAPLSLSKSREGVARSSPSERETRYAKGKSKDEGQRQEAILNIDSSKPTERTRRMQTKLLPVKKLRLDGDTQPRVKIDEDLVAEYAAAYKAGVKMPPVVVFFDGTDHWLADGFHRRFGAIKAKLAKMRCEVHKGTREDARWYSYSANQTHGLRRSPADKVKAIKAALKHPAGVKKSDRQIAEHVGVAPTTVGKYRKELESSVQIGQIETRTVQRGDQEYEQDTSNIGKGKPEVEYEKCPKCGGENFYADGTCASCVPDIDPGEETDVKPTDPATILKCDIRDVVQSWIKKVKEANLMLAAAVLDNFAEELRNEQ